MKRVFSLSDAVEEKMLKDLKNKVLKYLSNRHMRKCLRYIKYINKHNPGLFKEVITDSVAKFANQTIMQMLDEERVCHCAFCPKRFSLRKHNLKYVCPNHYKLILKKEKETKEKEDRAIKP